MSNYQKTTQHPVTKKWQLATWRDDYFGRHNYGVEFPNDIKVYDVRKVVLKTRETKVKKPVIPVPAPDICSYCLRSECTGHLKEPLVCTGLCATCHRACEKPVVFVGTVTYSNTWTPSTLEERVTTVELENSKLLVRQNVAAIALVLLTALIMVVGLMK